MKFRLILFYSTFIPHIIYFFVIISLMVNISFPKLSVSIHPHTFRPYLKALLKELPKVPAFDILILILPRNKLLTASAIALFAWRLPSAPVPHEKFTSVLFIISLDEILLPNIKVLLCLPLTPVFYFRKEGLQMVEKRARGTVSNSEIQQSMSRKMKSG